MDRTFADLDYIAETVVPRLRDQMKWAGNLSYAKVRVSDDVKIAGGERSDSTGNLAVGKDQERIRKATKRARLLILKAMAVLEEADGVLNLAFDRTHYKRVDNRISSSMISHRELRDARAAQRRRRERGEGFG